MFEELFGSVFAGSLAALALAGLLLAIGARVIPKLRDEEQGYPYEDSIEKLVLPYAARAVMLAYEMAERALQETGQVMGGVDKKAVADDVYRYLPDHLKRWVSPDAWSEFVQQAYDGARNLGLTFWKGFEKEYDRWKAENVEGE